MQWFEANLYTVYYNTLGKIEESTTKIYHRGREGEIFLNECFKKEEKRIKIHSHKRLY